MDDVPPVPVTTRHRRWPWFRIAAWTFGAFTLLVIVAFWLPALAIVAARHHIISRQTVETNGLLSSYWYILASKNERHLYYGSFARRTGLFDDVCDTIFWRCLMTQPVYLENNPPCGLSMSFREDSAVTISELAESSDSIVE